MALKIEKKPILVTRARASDGNQDAPADIYAAIKQLKVGESFVTNRNRNSVNVYVNASQYLLDRKFSTLVEGTGTRIGRTA